MKAKKTVRLASVGLATAVAAILYLYVFHEGKLYATLRCWQAAPSIFDCYGTTPFDFSTTFFGMRYQGNFANHIDREVLIYGAYEKHVLYFARETMRRLAPNQSGVFVDVGANVGEYSFFMSHYSKEVHAFEPYEPVLQRFRGMIKLNGIENIKIYPVGLGSKAAKIPFYKPPETALGGGSFVEDFHSFNKKGEELEIMTGDEALKKVGAVRLIKIDVEGYEKEVLLGLKETLARHRPVILFELGVKSKESFGFKSKQDIQDVLPENYRIVSFDMMNFDLYKGFYRLVEFDRQVRFDKPLFFEIVAYPMERETEIPRSNPQ